MAPPQQGNEPLSGQLATQPSPPASTPPRPRRSAYLSFSPPLIGEEEIAEVVDTLRSDWITTGPKVAQFEAEFAAAVSAPAAVAVNSCTAALHTALLANGIGPGDEVITTPLTFAATVNVVEHVGARPVLVDVERDTLTIDPARIEAAITGRTRDRRLDPCGIDRERVPLHIDEYRPGTNVLDDVDGRGERERRRDDFVARADSVRQQRRVEGSRARVDRDGRRGRDGGRELRLELRDLGAGGDPVGAQSIDDFGDLLLPDERRREGEIGTAPRSRGCAGSGRRLRRHLPA